MSRYVLSALLLSIFLLLFTAHADPLTEMQQKNLLQIHDFCGPDIHIFLDGEVQPDLVAEAQQRVVDMADSLGVYLARSEQCLNITDKHVATIRMDVHALDLRDFIWYTSTIRVIGISEIFFHPTVWSLSSFGRVHPYYGGLDDLVYSLESHMERLGRLWVNLQSTAR